MICVNKIMYYFIMHNALILLIIYLFLLMHQNLSISQIMFDFHRLVNLFSFFCKYFTNKISYRFIIFLTLFRQFYFCFSFNNQFIKWEISGISLTKKSKQKLINNPTVKKQLQLQKTHFETIAIMILAALYHFLQLVYINYM